MRWLAQHSALKAIAAMQLYSIFDVIYESIKEVHSE